MSLLGQLARCITDPLELYTSAVMSCHRVLALGRAILEPLGGLGGANGLFGWLAWRLLGELARCITDPPELYTSVAMSCRCVWALGRAVLELLGRFEGLPMAFFHFHFHG